MRKWIVCAALAALGVVACGNAATSSASISQSRTRDQGAPLGPAGQANSSGRPAGSAGTQPVPPPVADSTVGPANLTAPTPVDGPRVIRTGRVTLEVGNGSFNDRLDQLGAVVASEKGYIADSGNAGQPPEPGGLRVATFTYQIPAASFDDALTKIRKLGTLESLAVTGQDVSSQYVDLHARLRVQQEQRDFYLSLLAQAKTTQDIISVRNQLSPILDQIERLQGQIDYFDHATTYATLSVTLREAAAGLAPTADAWGFRSALLQAARLFVNTVNSVVVVLGALGPFLLIGIPLLVVAWKRRPRRTSSAAQA